MQVMLDSGAFGVWTRGLEIDVDEYIRFCRQNPKVTYYIALDVIPGSVKEKKVTGKQVKTACEEGWYNYQCMIKKLPKEKVMPVFHQGDDIVWLKRYIDAGVKYIGISPSNSMTTKQRYKWLTEGNKINNFILDASGKPIIKTHGFGVTSTTLMKRWYWHSVDSASWVREAGYGNLWYPRLANGEFRYDDNARGQIAMSERKLDRSEHSIPSYASLMMDTSKIGSVSKSANKPHKNFWRLSPDSMKRHEIESYIRDVVKSTPELLRDEYFERRTANVEFINRLEEQIEVKHIYFAGSPHKKRQKGIRNKLFSFVELMGQKTKNDTVIKRLFNEYIELC